MYTINSNSEFTTYIIMNIKNEFPKSYIELINVTLYKIIHFFKKVSFSKTESFITL